MRQIRVAFVFLVSLMVFLPTTWAQNDIPPSYPWELSKERIYQQPMIEHHICSSDQDSNMICLEFIWREGNFELYAFAAHLKDEKSFREGMVPEIIIDGKMHGDINKLLETDRWLGYEGYPNEIGPSGRTVSWRISTGSPARMASTKKSIYYELLHAQSLALRSYFSNGDVQTRVFPTENLAAGLELIFKEAALMESVYGDYEEGE